MHNQIEFLTGYRNRQALELKRPASAIYKNLKRGEINGINFGLLTLGNPALNLAGKRIAMLQRRDKLKTARKMREDVVGTTGALMGVEMALRILDGGCLI